MKTKNLVSVSVLATMLAACSNELETPGVAPGANDANRPVAGKVVVVPNVVENAEEASTRADWTGSRWLFEKGDNFGAMLMDTWNGTHEGNTTVADYTFTDYVHTNYKYTADGSGLIWACKDDDQILAGNYFFYYPYNEGIRERGYVRNTLNNHQSNYDATENNVNWSYAVRDNQQYVGYAFVPSSNEDINEVPVDFYPLFATPKFKLQNVSGMDLRLVKLIIRTHQHGPAATPGLMPTTMALAPYSADFKAVAADYPGMTQKEQIASLFSHSTLLLDGWFAGDSKSDGLETDNKKGVYEYTVEFGDNYVVPAGEFFKACAVMPAGEYFDFDVYALVEEQNSEKTTGIVEMSSLKTAKWTGFDTQSGAMQTVLKPGITQVFSASFDAEALQNLGIKDFTVATSEDLEWVLNLKAEYGGTELLVVKTLGDQVELNQNVYNWLADEAHKGIRVLIDGKIVIPVGVPADAIDQLTTGAMTGITTTIINKGVQELEKDLESCDVINYGTLNGNVTINGDVQNAEGATLDVTTVKGNVTNAGKSLTINTIEGDLTNAGGADKEGNLNNAIVENVKGDAYNFSGALTINNVTGTLENYSKVTVKKGELNIVENSKNTMHAMIDIVEETIIKDLTNERGGIVNITDDSEISGKNLGTINIKEGATVMPASEMALINNINGDGTIIGIINVTDADLKYTNNTAANTTSVQNNGIINVIGKSHVAVTGGYGIIDITEANKEGGFQASSVDTKNQYFRYCGAVKAAELQNLIAEENYGENPVILEFNETATQKENLTGAKIRKILIHEGVTLTLSGKFWLQDEGMVYPSDPIEALGDSYKALEVEKNATLQVVNGTTLIAADSFKATVDGKFRVENRGKVTTENSSTVSVDGTGVVEAAMVNFGWTKGTFTGNWTVK